MEENYVIGVDFGSDSVRCLVVNADDGCEIASTVEYYPRWASGKYCDPATNRYRQHPLDYLESLETVIRKALVECGHHVVSRIRAISFDTTASTPVLTDRYVTPLALLPRHAENPDAMFMLWKDHSAVHEADEINELAHLWKPTIRNIREAFTPANGSGQKYFMHYGRPRHCATTPGHGSSIATGSAAHSRETPIRKPCCAADAPQVTRPCGTSRGAACRHITS